MQCFSCIISEVARPFAFCSVRSRFYDWRRQAISLYRSEPDSNGKGNSVSCAECWILFWVSLCPDGSPKPLPSFPLHYFKVGDVGGTVAPVMPHILLCCSLPMVKEFPFPDVSASCTEAVKNIWTLNCCWDEAILNLFCLLLFPP